MPPTQVVVLIVLVWLITVCCVGITYVWKGTDKLAMHDRTNMYGPVEKWTSQDGANGKPTSNERLNSAFEKRIEQYKKNLESQNSNLWYQVMCIAIALIIVLTKSDDFKVPGIDARVKIRWVFWGLPLCLLYLWMSFGFRLHELIDTRIALYKIAEAQHPKPSNEKDNNAWHAVTRTFGNYPAANDGGIMDGWFISFRYDYSLEPDEQPYKYLYQTAAGFSMFLVGAFLGVSNGTIPGLLLNGKRRFARTKPKVRVLIDVAFWLAIAVLVFTHLTFWYGGQHINWLQPEIAFFGCLTVWAFAVARIPAEPK